MYEADSVQDRLQNLTEGMLRGKKTAPKIRCNAAQCRALVSICKALAIEKLDAAVPIEQAVIVGLDNLDACYQHLSDQSIFWKDGLRSSSIRFAQQYVALEAAFAGVWKK